MRLKVLQRLELIQVRLPAGVSLKLAGLLGQAGQQGGGEQIQTQAVIADPVGQVRQFIQVFAQAAAERQPVLIAQLKEAALVGFQQLKQLAQVQHPAIVELHFAGQDKPVALLLQAQLQLAHARPRLDAHPLAFRPDALQPLAIQQLQLTEHLQGILRVFQLPLLTIAVGLGQRRARRQHPVQGGGFGVQVATGLQGFAVLLTEHVGQPDSRLEPTAVGQRAHQQLQAQAALQGQ